MSHEIPADERRGRHVEKMGCRADLAVDGAETLAAVARQPYDGVLMDVQMPVMDGPEATRRIAGRWPREERPHIVAMTANAMQGDREACLAAGMDDHLGKPIRVDALVDALCRVVPRGAGRPPASTPDRPLPVSAPDRQMPVPTQAKP